ncbi:hypothetical protein ACLKA7_005216 [Drosophila subpalustris]
MASEYESVKGQNGGRPRNPFRTSLEVASAPVSGVQALPAPGEATIQMTTQNGGPRFNPRREGVAKCVGGILSDRWEGHACHNEDCVRRWAIQGEAQNVQAWIQLGDGFAIEVERSLKVDGGMTAKVVNMPLLIMPTLLDHVLIGMDFLCAMGTTMRGANVASSPRLVRKGFPRALRLLLLNAGQKQKKCSGDSSSSSSLQLLQKSL